MRLERNNMNAGDSVRYSVRGNPVTKIVVEVGQDYFIYSCDGAFTPSNGADSVVPGYAKASLSSVGTDYELIVQ